MYVVYMKKLYIGVIPDYLMKQIILSCQMKFEGFA